MARSVEQRLSALRKLDVAAPNAVDEVRDAVRSSTGILVAARAKIIADHRLEALIPEFVPAFERHRVVEPSRCRA